MAPPNTPPTNEEFAEKVGCDFTTVSRWRNGSRLPSPAALGRIVEAFDLSRDEAFGNYTAGAEQFGQFIRRKVFREL
jgi:transcriptional regulator with XRE-family HTH domain